MESRQDTERLDELVAENMRLAEVIERYRTESEHYRVLVLADGSESIEVYADARVKVAVGCVPDSQTIEEYDQALSWALKGVPYEFRGMVNDPAIRPEPYTTRCLSRERFRYMRRQTKLWSMVESLQNELETLRASEAT